LQLRLVETLARHVGMERALRAAEGEELLEQEEGLEGPPVPRALRLSQDFGLDHDGRAIRIVPAPVLVVRSVRAATRYLLVVVLTLELTAVAVGYGSIYGLIERFYWWASIPFVIYFLQLWRPHIISAYQRLVGPNRTGKLSRLVQRSERRFYGVFVVGAAFVVVSANRVAQLVRRYLSTRDATKRLLAFLFRRRLARQAEQAGRVVAKRQELPQELVGQFPNTPLARSEGAFEPPTMEPIEQAYKTWLEEKADGSVALVGPRGMGKSTVLKMLDNTLEVTVVRGRPSGKLVRTNQVVSWLAEVFGYSPRPTSEKELVRAIREEKRPIVALDDCHNLFLRRVGGFEGWDAFVRIVNETCHKIFWLASFNQTSWGYLFNAAGRVHYFRQVLKIEPWGERRIQRLLMHRMRRARFRTSFSDLVAAQMPDFELATEAGRTSAGYFRMLWDFTGGNPRLAAHFWLDSLVPQPGEREVRVNLFKEPAIEELDALAPDVAFVLTAIAVHENLSAEEAARTTGLSLDFCRFACRSCLEDGFLERGEAKRFRLSVRWQRPVLRFLRRKHLLHDE
jgi:energy-coupling factor transporter ATP-binding protein EcfA2